VSKKGAADGSNGLGGLVGQRSGLGWVWAVGSGF